MSYRLTRSIVGAAVNVLRCVLCDVNLWTLRLKTSSSKPPASLNQRGETLA